MSNSKNIRKAKNIIIKELISDKEIIKALDVPNIDANATEKLINKYIFDYHQNPNTVETTSTIITLQVHIPSEYYSQSVAFIKPTIEIWIISHQRKMSLKNIPKQYGNRNDYISELLDAKLNGRTDFGFGVLNLKSNVEGALQQDYLYRKMVFEFTDLNNSLCKDE